MEDGGDRDLSQSKRSLGLSFFFLLLSLRSVGWCVRSRALRPATFELSKSVYSADDECVNAGSRPPIENAAIVP